MLNFFDKKYSEIEDDDVFYHEIQILFPLAPVLKKQKQGLVNFA